MTDTANFTYKNSVKELDELIHLVYNMRHKEKLYKDQYGSYAKNQKLAAEAKVDKWLEDHRKK